MADFTQKDADAVKEYLDSLNNVLKLARETEKDLNETLGVLTRIQNKYKEIEDGIAKH